MSFESGNLSMRAVRVPTTPDATFFSGKLQIHCLPVMSKDEVGPEWGWVTGQHLLDRELNEDSIAIGSGFRFALACCRRRIDKGMYEARCRQDEHAAAGAGGNLNRRQRGEIRDNIRNQMLKEAPVSVGGVHCALFEGWLMIGTTSEAAYMQVVQRLTAAGVVEKDMLPMLPDAQFTSATGCRWGDLAGACFGGTPSGEFFAWDIGEDFLTWCWYVAECCNGLVTLEDAKVAISVAGPLKMVAPGDESGMLQLSSEVAPLSHETAVALSDGRKLQRCELMLALNQIAFTVEVDAVDFAFRKLRCTPPVDEGTREERDLARLEQFASFLDLFNLTFRHFAQLRASKAWPKTETAMRTWVADKAAK